MNVVFGCSNSQKSGEGIQLLANSISETYHQPVVTTGKAASKKKDKTAAKKKKAAKKKSRIMALVFPSLKATSVPKVGVY